MKFLFILLLFSTSIYSKYLSISPEFVINYSSDDEQYAYSNAEIKEFEFCFLTSYNKNKINIISKTGYHFIDGFIEFPSSFTMKQGLFGLENPPGLGNKQRNYYISDMKIEYGDSTFQFYLYKWDKHWGPGKNSILLSNKVPNFLHLGFNWKINNHLKFEYFHGKLESQIENTNYSNYYLDINSSQGRTFDVARNIVGHRLEWAPYENIILSGTEFVTYANRFLEYAYALPFVPFFPLQTYIGETDNVIMAIDIEVFFKKSKIYTSFLLDEWSPPYTFSEDNRNWFAWMAGFNVDHFLFKESVLNLEYVWTDHRVYRHRFKVNDYYSYNYPVGFWAGPHSETVYFDYQFNMLNNHFIIKASSSKRGALTDSMLVDQYKRPNDDPIYFRYSEGFEKKNIFSISMVKNFSNRINFKISYEFVNWDNAGFDPFKPVYGLDNIKKQSINFRIKFKY